MDKHHNMPPLADRLAIDHASLAAQVSDVLALPGLDPIMGDDDLEAYSERAKALKGVGAMVEKARKAEKDQILKDGRTIDDFFGRLAKQIKDAADGFVAAINGWQRKKLEEDNRRRAEEAARLEAERTPLDDPDEAPPVAPPPQAAARVVSSATGKVTASVSRIWKGEVIDPAQVPRQFLMVNQNAIDAAIKGGVREIPGVRIFEDVRTAIR